MILNHIKRETDVYRMRSKLIDLVYQQFSEWSSGILEDFVEGLKAHHATGTVEDFVEHDRKRIEQSTENAIKAIERIEKMTEDEVRRLYAKKFGTA